MVVVLLIAAAVIVGGVVVVAVGRGGVMADSVADMAPLEAQVATAADVAMLRPPSALWGYNMQITEEVLGRIAQAIIERDVEIGDLRRQLAELQPSDMQSVSLARQRQLPAPPVRYAQYPRQRSPQPEHEPQRPLVAGLPPGLAPPPGLGPPVSVPPTVRPRPRNPRSQSRPGLGQRPSEIRRGLTGPAAATPWSVWDPHPADAREPEEDAMAPTTDASAPATDSSTAGQDPRATDAEPGLPARPPADGS